MPPIKKDEILRVHNIIEDLVWKYDISYIEAVVMFCEEHDFEIEQVPKYLSDSIKAELQREAENLSLLKGEANNDFRLPV